MQNDCRASARLDVPVPYNGPREIDMNDITAGENRLLRLRKAILEPPERRRG